MSLPLTPRLMKYLLFIFNLIFVLTGIILIVAGASVQVSYNSYDRVLDQGFYSVPVLLIIIGTIVFIVSFFGCCGAFKENYCMTVTFCACLILIFVLELSGGIAGYMLRDRAGEVIDKSLEDSMHYYNKTNQDVTTHFWDDMQVNLHCCGARNGTADWIAATKTNSSSGYIPLSCCGQLPEHDNPGATCSADKAFKDHCDVVLLELLKGNGAILGGVGIAIAIIQLLGIIFACNLASSIRKDYESV